MTHDLTLIFSDKRHRELTGIPQRCNDVVLRSAGMLRGPKSSNSYSFYRSDISRDFFSNIGHFSPTA